MLKKVTFEDAINDARGDLSLRLARNTAEIEAAQRLRFKVFYEELNARPQGEAAENKRDADDFDAICDHLLVVRKLPPFSPAALMLDDGELVGTYRLLRQEVAIRHNGFYTAAEFDIAPLLARKPMLSFLELGRSCVLQPFRTKPVVELLWQGIWNYVREYRLDVMLGCASLEGTDPNAHAATLSFLAQNSLAPEEWQVSARSERYVEMNRLPSTGIDQKRALRDLPPLVKGYLRLGCYIGHGAVIDRQFNTTDVLIILPVSVIKPKYFGHFGQPASD
jgi:L-ornithine Nalpha-acyltransferase